MTALGGGAGAGIFGSTPAIAQPLAWIPLQPMPRTSAAMAFDSARGSAVLFGGTTSTGTPFRETWEWRGSAWSRRAEGATPSPSARSEHAMAYDATREAVVLFGGRTGPSALDNETWQWNGVDWTRQTTDPLATPSPRSGHAMAYDSARAVTVLFGGLTGADQSSAETWEWNGVSWTLRNTGAPSPSARHGHAMVYDAARAVTVLFGGIQQGAESDETWEWDGDHWTHHREVIAPTPRHSHTMAYDTDRLVTVLFGGASGSTTSSETWEWNGDAWLRPTLTGPPAQAHHAMTYDSRRARTVLIGNTPANPTDIETWEWDGDTWSRRTDSTPSPRYAHAMAYDSARNLTVVYGGSTGNVVNDETWEWNGANWTRLGVHGPPARHSAAMAYDSARAVTVLFGGFPTRGETWEWNGAEWSRRLVVEPSPRSLHAMVYDSRRAVTVLFGGATVDGVATNQTWEWDGIAWTFRTVSGPSARTSHSMAYDSARGVTVLFGGNETDTWEWDGVSWIERKAKGPPARSGAAMAYDAARCVTVLFGGSFGSTRFDDIWEWDGNVWTRQPPTGPSARSSHKMVYDPAREAIVLFGGFATTATGDTWGFGPGCLPNITAQPAPRTSCYGDSASFTVTVEGSESRPYEWHKNGVILTDVPGQIVGAQTATLTLFHIGPLDAAYYDCVISNICGTVLSEPGRLAVGAACRADFSCDSFVNSQDLFDFLVAFFANAREADFNADALVDSMDFFDFVATFFLPC